MIVLILLCVVAVVSANNVTPYSLSEGPQYFEDFIKTHNKVYSSDEEKAMRYQIFLKNLEQINQLNAEYEHTGFGVNQFTDLTLQEFQARHKSLKVPAEYYSNCTAVNLETKNKYENLKIPIHNNVSYDNFDWRDTNVVTRVKNHGPCGASWAFSAIGNVESLNAIHFGKLVELSEQQLVDCDYSNDGCLRGDPIRAMGYIIRRGLMSNEDYPYKAKNQFCRYHKELVGVYVKGCMLLNGDEHAIAEQLLAIGPLSIVLDTTSLFHYEGGVLRGHNCRYSISELNNAVLLVGYGVDSHTGLPYWTLKNSWGEDFGEKGYFRIQRGVHCLGFGVAPAVTAVLDTPVPIP